MYIYHRLLIWAPFVGAIPQKPRTLVLSPFFKWGNGGPETDSDLPKDTQMLSVRAGIWTFLFCDSENPHIHSLTHIHTHTQMCPRLTQEWAHTPWLTSLVSWDQDLSRSMSFRSLPLVLVSLGSYRQSWSLAVLPLPQQSPPCLLLQVKPWNDLSWWQLKLLTVDCRPGGAWRPGVFPAAAAVKVPPWSSAVTGLRRPVRPVLESWFHLGLALLPGSSGPHFPHL